MNTPISTFAPSGSEAATALGGSARGSASAPLPGVRIGSYVIQDMLGAGGSGRVYKVWDASLRRSLALKLLPAAHTLDATLVARFQREVETLARLSHPNVVKVFGAGDYEGSPWFVMDLLDGRNLEQVGGGKGMDARRAAALMVEVASGVHYLHKEGVIHRDIKPANIVLTKSGTPVLTDFGLAQTLHQRGDLTRTGLSVGTPAYMSPEQARGQKESIGIGADVWQLGATLFALLAGRPPYRADNSAAIMLKVAEGQGPDFTGVFIPRPLRAVILKAMAPKPGARYESAAAFGADLSRWLSGEWVLARGGGRMMRKLHATRRYWVPAGVALLGAIITIAALVTSGQRIPDISRPTVFMGTDSASLKLSTIGDVRVSESLGRTLLERAGSAEGHWVGLATPLDLGPPGYGWGDWTASFEFGVPDARMDAVGTGLMEAPEADSPGPLAGPAHPAVICFVGGSGAVPTKCVGVQLVPSRGVLEVTGIGGTIGWARFPPPAPDSPRIRVEVTHRGLTVSVGVVSVADGRQLASAQFSDFTFRSAPQTWPSRRLGILTTGSRMEVGEVRYHQLAERGDLPEFFVRHRMYPEALDRISVRLGALGAELTAAERARLEYFRGLCLMAMGGEQAGQARQALSAANESGDSGVAFLASLADLGIAVDAWISAAAKSAPAQPLPEFPGIALRRARGHATTESRQSQLAAMLAERAAKAWHDPAGSTGLRLDVARALLETAKAEVLRDSHGYAMLLGTEVRLLAMAGTEASGSESGPSLETRNAAATFLRELGSEAARRTDIADVLEVWPQLAGSALSGTGIDSAQKAAECRTAASGLASLAPKLLQLIENAPEPSPQAQSSAGPPSAQARPVLAGLVYLMLDDLALGPASPTAETQSRLASALALLPHAELPPETVPKLELLLRAMDRNATQASRIAALDSIKLWPRPEKNSGPSRDPLAGLDDWFESPGRASNAIWAELAMILSHVEAGDLTSARSAASALTAATASTPWAWYHRSAAAWRDFKPESQPGR